MKPTRASKTKLSRRFVMRISFPNSLTNTCKLKSASERLYYQKPIDSSFIIVHLLKNDFMETAVIVSLTSLTVIIGSVSYFIIKWKKEMAKKKTA